MRISKENVLSNVSGVFEPFGGICYKMAQNMQRAINVSDVKLLLFQLVNEGRVETHLRNEKLHYRKT